VRVALYHPWIYLKSGLERTILEIARRSRHQWDLHTSHYDADGTYPELRDFGIRETGRVSVKRSYGAVLSAAAHIARSRLPLDGAEALVVCCDGLGTFITLRNDRLPTVNLCFTPLRAVYDHEYRARHLARHHSRRRLALVLEKGYMTADRLLWRRYRRVICISQTVRDRVVEGRLYPRAALDILYPGVDSAEIVPSERAEPFFFLPGRIMWTKNIELGIEAFLHLRRSTGCNYRLLIAGMVDHKGQDYYTRLRAMAASDEAIAFHVGPSDGEMRDYYERCAAVLFTAFNEDLGLTPMEAMARGKPVVAVDRGGPREVVENGVTGYRTEADPVAFAAGMRRLIDAPAQAQAMGRAGAERVRRFTWDTFVQGLDDIVEAAVVDARRR
jgi:glycosyltransferase involved in cell wall biosynthesis